MVEFYSSHTAKVLMHGACGASGFHGRAGLMLSTARLVCAEEGCPANEHDVQCFGEWAVALAREEATDAQWRDPRKMRFLAYQHLRKFMEGYNERYKR